MFVYRIDVPTVVLIGTAGSGKTRLANALFEAAVENREIYPVMVNLDPGVRELPYEPDVDIREFVTVDELLDQGYGPNGALIAAVDKIVEFLGPLTGSIKALEPEMVIVDTPGQMELFTHRPWGEFVVRHVFGPRTVSLFLYDPIVSMTPEGYLSLAFMDISVRVRLNVTSLATLSKADVLEEEQREYILKMATDLEFLKHEISYRNLPYAMAMANVLDAFRGEVLTDLIPSSAKGDPGTGMLRGEIEEVLGLNEPRRYARSPA